MGAGITFNGMVQLMAFCVFEVMVGLFWPSMMKMRSEYVPEEMRSTIINFFRIPLNLFVCIILYNVRTAELTTFWLAIVIHFTAQIETPTIICSLESVVIDCMHQHCLFDFCGGLRRGREKSSGVPCGVIVQTVNQ